MNEEGNATVTADGFDALAAFLRHEFTTYKDMLVEVDNKSFARALAAIFFVAMDRKFDDDASLADVVRFVGEARAQFDDTGDKIASGAAERLIRAVLFEEEEGLADDLDPNEQGAAEMALVAAAAEQGQWTGKDIAELVAEAREFEANT